MALKQWLYEQMKETFFSSFYLSLFFFISVLYVLNLARKTKSKTNLNLPPSPPKLPFIGNLHQLGALPHRSLLELSVKYGDIMLLQLGQMQNPSLVVSSVDAAMEIMRTHDMAFSNRSQNTSANILMYGCTDVVFGVYGENWRHKKKLCVVELLSMKRVQSFHVVREEEAAKLVNQVREVSYRECNVDISEMFTSISNNIMSKCALGRNYTDGNNSFKHLSRNVMIHLTDFTVRDYFPWLSWVDVLTGKIQKYKATFKALDALFDKVIAEHLAAKREGDHSNRRDLVDTLIELQDSNMHNFDFTTNDIKALLLDMYVGGADTTETTLEWTMTELMRNPKTMKKVQEEVRKIVGNKSKIEESDINQMYYLKCAIKESLRLHPPASILAPRETISNVKLKGYDIPAKTKVFINIWAMQRDPKFWESPEQFLPERFENSKIDFQGQDFQFIPFGFGRRRCPGINFGIASVECVLANLLYWFDWKLPKSDTLKHDIDMGERFGIVVSKKVPLHLKPIVYSF